MLHLLKKNLLFLFFLYPLTFPLHAANVESLSTVYVTSFNDPSTATTNNDCSSSLPSLSGSTNCPLRKALRVVKNDTDSIIEIPSGNYCLNSALGQLEITDKSMTLVGGYDDGEKTIIGYKPYTREGGEKSSDYLIDCDAESPEGEEGRVLFINLKADTESTTFVVKMENLVLANGKSTETDGALYNGMGGGILIFADASATTETMGAIVSGGLIDITLKNIIVSGNEASAGGISGGGGMSISAYAYAFPFAKNTHVSGGKINITLSENVTFENNITNGNGGGMDVNLMADVISSQGSTVVGGSVEMTISDHVTITGNESSVGGGATLFALINSGSSSSGSSVTGGQLLLTFSDHVEITKNTALQGGGIALYSGSNNNGSGSNPVSSVTFKDHITVSDNKATDGNGGGFMVGSDGYKSNSLGNTSNQVVIEESIFKNNQANGDGGGVYIASYGGIAGYDDFSFTDVNLVLSRVSFIENEGINGGGLAFEPESDLDGNLIHLGLENSTFSDNQATLGGAIYLSDQDGDEDASLTADISYNTLTNNTASSQGGGIFSQYWEVTIGQSILASNVKTGGSTKDSECLFDVSSAASFISAGYNILPTTSASPKCSYKNGSTYSSVTLSSTDIKTISELALDSLEEDSVTGQFTYSFGEDSTALDAIPQTVCDLTVDQRSKTRPQDGNGDGVVACDIGAFEKEDVSGSETGESSGGNPAENSNFSGGSGCSLQF